MTQMKRRKPPSEDYDIINILNLNGTIFNIKGQYWVKFEVWEVDPTPAIPHGIRYNITLHDSYNTRIIGYDNAHGCKPKSRKYKARKTTWDHIHQKNKILMYEFDSAGQLLEDFWEAVNSFIEE